MDSNEIKTHLKDIRDGLATINFSVEIAKDTGDGLIFWCRPAIQKMASALYKLDKHFAENTPP